MAASPRPGDRGRRTAQPAHRQPLAPRVGRGAAQHRLAEHGAGRFQDQRDSGRGDRLDRWALGAPDRTAESFAAELRAFVGDEVAIEIDQYTPPLEASSDTPLFRTIAAVMQEREPSAPVLPYLMPAGTDAKHIVPRRPETQIYGFMPYRQQPSEEEMELIHGHDERTSVQELLFATQVLYESSAALGK